MGVLRTAAAPAVASHRPAGGRPVPGYLRLARPDRPGRRDGVLALRYLVLVGGVVGCALILGAPVVLAGVVGAVVGTGLGLIGGAR